MDQIEIRRVAIFGAGISGRASLEVLRNHGIKIPFFVDNLLPLPAEVQGIPVHRLSHLMEDGYRDIDAVVLASASFEQMRDQLHSLGFAKPVVEKIEWCDFRESGLKVQRPMHYDNLIAYNRNVTEGREIIDNAPLLLIASVAHGCNIDCGMCYLNGEHELAKGGVRNHLQMSEETYAEVARLVPKVRDALITVEGEILLFKKWLNRWLRLLEDHPDMHISMQTNGMLLNDETIAELLANPRVVRIAISIDGASPEVNDTIRHGAKLEKVEANIRALIKAKAAKGQTSPMLHSHFVMQRSNIHELPQWILRMGELGIRSLSARHIIVQKREQIRDSLYFYQTLSDDFLEKAREVATQYQIPIDLPQSFAEAAAAGVTRRPTCHEPWKHGQVLHDGSVYSCCNNAVLMGNINQGGFEAIWNNEKYQKLRRTINSPDLDFTMCKYCNAMMPVNCFEAHVETKLLYRLMMTGELESWCPGPYTLLMKPEEAFVE